MAETKLPVANSAQVKAEGLRLMRMHKKPLAGVVGLYVVSAVAGLAGPFLLGRLVDAISQGTTAGFVATVALSLAGFVIVQTAAGPVGAAQGHGAGREGLCPAARGIHGAGHLAAALHRGKGRNR